MTVRTARAIADADQERLLLAVADGGGTDAVSDLVEDVEENWIEPNLSVSTDKAWEAMHRILGGRHLHDGFYVVYVSASQAQDVAQALHQVDEAWLRQRFDAMDAADYGGAQDAADFAYTWESLIDVRAFYDRAAKAVRAVIFTAS